jgi:hypothetical protein
LATSSTGRGSTYTNRNGVSTNPATSEAQRDLAGVVDGIPTMQAA